MVLLETCFFYFSTTFNRGKRTMEKKNNGEETMNMKDWLPAALCLTLCPTESPTHPQTEGGRAVTASLIIRLSIGDVMTPALFIPPLLLLSPGIQAFLSKANNLQSPSLPKASKSHQIWQDGGELTCNCGPEAIIISKLGWEGGLALIAL